MSYNDATKLHVEKVFKKTFSVQFRYSLYRQKKALDKTARKNKGIYN